MSEKTKEYFDSVADQYGQQNEDYTEFPTTKIRNEIVVDEACRLQGHNKSSMDLGCGAGQLMKDLHDQLQYHIHGVDISPHMIEVARKLLGDAGRTTIDLDPNEPITFDLISVQDALTVDVETPMFDVVTAIGLIEYLPDDDGLFRVIRNCLVRGGTAFVECRNRLFNLYTANQYTINEFYDTVPVILNTEDLIRQLNEVGKYVQANEKDPTWLWLVLRSMTLHDKGDSMPKPFRNIEPLPPYPSDGTPRRQHTPEELEASLKKADLKLKHVIFYHPHPFMPRYEKLDPQFFNRLAVDMKPLGYTPIGASMCSAFIAVIDG